MRIVRATLLCLACALALACGREETRPKPAPAKAAPAAKPVGKEGKAVSEQIQAQVAKFAPTSIGVDAAKVPEKVRKVVKKLVQAAELMDQLYLQQVARENPRWRGEIAQDPSLGATLAYFDIMYGPWDRLDHNKPFFGTKEKPKGVTFYPEDLTAAELEKWIADHPADKAAFTGYFTVIERDGQGGLKAVPYAEAYKAFLVPAAKLLEEAAALTDDARLAKYLTSRARAFASNDYRQSDMDWMDLGDGALEVVVGPYEVYEDELMGYKAAFEAFVTLRDPADSERLAAIKALIPEMEAYLPIPDEYKSSKRGGESPISVVDVLFTAGDSRAGVQTLAFNLPNDEVVRAQKGSKKVMLKNVAHAKYDQILMPIARALMRPDQVAKVSFDAFFNHTLVHETAHGLGPGKITVEKNGKKVESTVNAELKDLYSAIEETKADVLGMYLNYLLIEKGLHPATFADETYAAFLGGFFRAVRFGAAEAHGKANLVQFNWLKEKGAVVVADGKYAYVPDKMREAVRSLAEEVLRIEATGHYDRAKALLDTYGKMPPELEAALRGLAGVPTDIRPVFPVLDQMKGW